MKPYLRILVAIAPLSLDMPVEESIAFQRLSDREIKTHLSLPDAFPRLLRCSPAHVRQIMSDSKFDASRRPNPREFCRRCTKYVRHGTEPEVPPQKRGGPIPPVLPDTSPRLGEKKSPERGLRALTWWGF